ncbi:MAG: hypothetical protein WCR30_02525 [Clostridia bacterium]
MLSSTENTFNKLKFNVMTKEIYDELSASGDISNSEIYVVDEQVDHNTLKNKNEGFQHTASTIIFNDLVSLQTKLDNKALCDAPEQATGSSTTKTMSQSAITTALNCLGSSLAPEQTTGTSTTKTISQAKISEELSKIYTALTSLGWTEE